MNTTYLLKAAPALLAGSLLLAGASTAHAQVTINYTTGVYSFTAPTNDAAFNLTSQSSSLTLVQGVAQTVNVQSVFFTVNDTQFQNDFTGTLSRSLTVNGIVHSAAQAYDLTTNFPDGVNTANASDTLILYPGTTSQVVNYNLGLLGIVQFTPEALDAGSFQSEDSGKYVSNVRGKFLLMPAAVPEASTTISFGLLLGGLALVGVRLRKRSAAGV